MLVTAATYLDALFLLLGDNSDRSRSMVKEFITATERDKNRKEIISGDDDELIDVYKMLIKTVISEEITQENRNASKILLLKIKSNEVIKSHPVIRDLLSDVLTAEEPISASQIDKYLKSIRNALLLAEADEANRKLFSRVQKAAMITDPDEQELELQKVKQIFDDSVKNIDRRVNSAENKASETYVSLSDKESIQRALEIFMDRNVRGVLRSGLQGLNRSLGDRGGFGLGEMAVFLASSHNYKTGMLVSIMLWTVLYNKMNVTPGKRPLVYFVSLENEVNQNLMDIFKILYSREERKKVDVNAWSVAAITEWLQAYFSKFDVELFIDRYAPHDFSYNRFTKRFNAFADLGYEMVAFILDYMSEARGIDPGDTMSAQGTIQLIRENYTKFRTHANQQGYFSATGHQLTKKAEELAQQYRNGVVKRFHPGLIADSSDVHRIVDLLFYLQLETNMDGVRFLTMVNRKNRGNKDTPENHKYCAYPFTEFGIMDDVDGIPMFVTDIDAFGSESRRDDAMTDSTLF